jgi:hypothetical protein
MIFDSRRIKSQIARAARATNQGFKGYIYIHIYIYPSENTRLVSRESRCHMTPVSQSWMGFEKHHPNHLIVRYGSKSSTQEIALQVGTP